MGIYSKAGTIEAGAGTQRPLLPEGFYPRLMIEECSSYDGQKRGTHYYKANVEVLEAANGVPAGTGGTFLVMVAGNEYPDHDVRGIGQVKDFIGFAMGLGNKLDRTQQIGEAEIEATVANGGKSLAGHVVSGTVSHKTTKGKGETISLYEFGLAGEGMVVVDPVTRQPKAAGVAAPQATTAPAANTAPVAAPAAAPAPKQPPAGWKPHTSPEWAAKGFFYNEANPADVRHIDSF